jgi:serine/threonine protein kinase
MKEEIEHEDLVLKTNIITPYKVKCFGYYFEDNYKCYVMEYCEKQTMSDFITQYKNKNENIPEEV